MKTKPTQTAKRWIKKQKEREVVAAKAKRYEEQTLKSLKLEGEPVFDNKDCWFV